MADVTVTSLTSDRMEAIEASSVVDGSVDLDGNFTLTKHDGSTIDAGNIKGPKGDLSVSLADAMPGSVIFNDDFQRPNQVLASGGNGMLAPTGQRYRSEGTVKSDGSDAALISGYRHIWADQITPGSDPIRILDAALDRVPNVVGAEFIFVAGTSNRQNAVIGCMPTDSFNNASIQLAIYPTKFRLFYVTASAQADVIYTDLPSPLAVDGTTRHQIFLKRDSATSTVIAECNGVILYSWTDPMVLTHWGKYVGFQERIEVAGDGSVEWTHIAASSPESAPSSQSASIKITGDVENYIRTNLPNFAPEDLRLAFYGTPSAGWASGHLQGLISKWSGSNNQKSWYLSVYNAGQLQFFMTTDGTTETHCTSAALQPGSKAVKAEYDASAATVLFSESADKTTWTTVGAGAIAIANAGTPFAGPANVPVTIGNHDNNSSFVFDGIIERVEIGSVIGGDPIAVADLTTIRGSSWYDDYGVQWALSGEWEWTLSDQHKALTVANLGAAPLNPDEGFMIRAEDTNILYIYHSPLWIPYSPDPLDSGWQALSLRSGYQSYDSSNAPQYRKIGNQVYTRGLIKKTTGTIGAGNQIIADIPVGMIPPFDKNVVAITDLSTTTGAAVRLVFQATGPLVMQSAGGSAFVNIDAVWLLT